MVCDIYFSAIHISKEGKRRERERKVKIRRRKRMREGIVLLKMR